MPAALVYTSRKQTHHPVGGLGMKRLLFEESARVSANPRVGYTTSGGVHWLYLHKSDGDHHLRTVLPSQIVYDLGDSGDWARCRRESEALWATLDILEIPHWRSLSGGRGTHTELFLRDWKLDRAAIHRRLRTLVYEVTGTWLIADERFVAAPDSNVLLREFGHSKTPGGHKKTLYPFTELPATRDEAYAKVPRVLYPESIPLMDCPWELPPKVESIPKTQAVDSMGGIGRNQAKALYDGLRESGELGHLDRFKLMMYLLRQGRTDSEVHEVFKLAKNYSASKTQPHIDHARRHYLNGHS